jgi:hypothetical protein
MPHIYPTAEDVIDVINYINARGSGPVPPTAKGPPYPDVTGDNNVVPDDVITIINYINAHPARAEKEAVDPSDELVMLLAMDVAGDRKRKS